MVLKETLNSSLLFLLPLVAEKGETWLDYTGAKNLYSTRDDSFVNGYNIDINKPWLDRHIFLLFEAAIDLDLPLSKLRRNENFKSKYTVKINKVFYVIYAYRIPDEKEKSYRHILDGDYRHISGDDKADIISFWEEGVDSLLFHSLYRSDKTLGKIENEEIYEVDYLPTREDIMHAIMIKDETKNAITC